MSKSTHFLTETDCYLFTEGIHYDVYHKLGAHPTIHNGVMGVCFAVWAPHAASVHVSGSFNQWSTVSHPMTAFADSGIYTCFIPDLQTGMKYQYAIRAKSGELFIKTDPYGFQSELRPATASVITDPDQYCWNDTHWQSRRAQTNPYSSPCAIYEVHPGSWRRNGDDFLNYRQLAHELTGYVLHMGYTHVELMGIAEHPYDGSWGYQVTGYYAPTSRYGSPDDFKYLVDYLHQAGIGVILDWVPAHFPKDPHGLADFDGSSLYESADPLLRDHPHWGTRIFDYSKKQVRCFLISNALYWVEEFHADGLRVDAVASMLYRDFGRDSDGWTPRQDQGRENQDAAALLRDLNTVMAKRHPGTLMIAEDSSTWPHVTGSPQHGGLGFTYKWCMGWMHDFLDYMKTMPYYRPQLHDRMTFSMTYLFDEHYLLPLSHDEVVHEKRALLPKMPGGYRERIANLKTAYTFMMGHPGKKLLFMGQEFGHWREWNENRPLDWDLLQQKEHRDLHGFFRDLLQLYRSSPALYENDEDWNGFQWIQCDDKTRSIFSFLRRSRTGRDFLLFVCNFSDMAYPDFSVGVPRPGTYVQLMNEHGLLNDEHSDRHFYARMLPLDDQPCSISNPLPSYGIQVYRFDDIIIH